MRQAVSRIDPALLEDLGAASFEKRSRAVARAVREVTPDDLVALVGREGQPSLRCSAMEALSRVGAAADRAILTAAAHDDECGNFCLQLLADRRGEASFALLCSAARAGSVLRRQAAVEALGTRRDPRALPVLAAALSDDPWVAAAAAVALCALDHPDAEEALARVDGWIAEAARSARSRRMEKSA